jgi:putative transposase
MIIQETLSDGLQLSITQSCHALEVSRSGYFKWRNQPGTIPFANSENKDLRDEIQEIALEFPGYGYRRITVELQNRGYASASARIKMRCGTWSAKV